jgi:hypothetical protein
MTNIEQLTIDKIRNLSPVKLMDVGFRFTQPNLHIILSRYFLLPTLYSLENVPR